MTAGLSTTIWNDLLGQVRMTHPQLVRTWFSQLEPTELDTGVLTIRTSNGAQSRYLEQHCRTAFVEAAQSALARLVSVEFDAPDEADAVAGDLREYAPKLNPDLTFSQFVTGPCNRFAHAAAVGVVKDPGREYNPLFLHGGVGLGKTHLLQAICHEMVARPDGGRCLYLSCEDFTNDFIEAVESGSLHGFRHRYRHADLLIIDDIQFLAARERSQEEFFHTFNTLKESGKQIVLSSDSAPGDIPSLAQRLVSRFHSGLVAALEQPCLDTRIAIVRSKAKLRCIEVSDAVVALVAQRIDGNVRELEGALIKIDAVSQTDGEPITVELARRALGDPSMRTPPVAAIMEAVAGRMGVRVSELESKRRDKSVTLPRHVCMYVTREVTSKSFEEIGGLFGGRDHTTVLHAHKTIAARLREDERLRGLVADIIADVRKSGR